MENQNKQVSVGPLESIGKVALLVGSRDKALSFIDLLEVLKKKSIAIKIIEVLDEGLSLLDKSIWQDVSRVFIAITEEHNLSFGHIQGLLDILCLEYTGCGMLTAALAVDIIKSKKIWQLMGIATTPFIKWRANVDWQEMIGLIGFPVAIKSICANDKRVFKVQHMEKLQSVSQNFKNLNDIIIEPWVTGDEYIIYIIDEQALLPLKISNFFITEAILPNKKSSNKKDNKENIELLNITKMQKLALSAFKAIGGSGFASVNILKDLNGDCWVLSVNTSPLMTRNSTFATAAHNSGINFEMLVEKILATSFVKKVNYNKFSILNK